MNRYGLPPPLPCPAPQNSVLRESGLVLHFSSPLPFPFPPRKPQLSRPIEIVVLDYTASPLLFRLARIFPRTTQPPKSTFLSYLCFELCSNRVQLTRNAFSWSPLQWAFFLGPPLNEPVLLSVLLIFSPLRVSLKDTQSIFFQVPFISFFFPLLTRLNPFRQDNFLYPLYHTFLDPRLSLPSSPVVYPIDVTF